MEAFVIITVIIVIIAIYIAGNKISFMLADIFGVDPRNIPSRTFAPNSVLLGGAAGAAIGFLGGGIVGGVIAGVIVAIIGYVVIFFIEVGLTSAISPSIDRMEDKYLNSQNGLSRANTSEGVRLSSVYNKDLASSGKLTNNNSDNPLIAYLILHDQIDSNEWICPKCRKKSRRYITTCECGCSFEEYQEYYNKAMKYKKEEEQRKKDEELQKENIKKEVLKEGTEKYGENLIVIRLLEKSSMSINEMIRQLPRSTDINAFKAKVECLENQNIISKDENGKYSIKK